MAKDFWLVTFENGEWILFKATSIIPVYRKLTNDGASMGEIITISKTYANAQDAESAIEI